MADWLEACGVDTVAIESIGIYWVPVYEILAAREFSVNALAEKSEAFISSFVSQTNSECLPPDGMDASLAQTSWCADSVAKTP